MPTEKDLIEQHSETDYDGKCLHCGRAHKVESRLTRELIDDLHAAISNFTKKHPEVFHPQNHSIDPRSIYSIGLGFFIAQQVIMASAPGVEATTMVRILDEIVDAFNKLSHNHEFLRARDNSQFMHAPHTPVDEEAKRRMN